MWRDICYELVAFPMLSWVMMWLIVVLWSDSVIFVTLVVRTEGPSLAGGCIVQVTIQWQMAAEQGIVGSTIWSISRITIQMWLSVLYVGCSDILLTELRDSPLSKLSLCRMKCTVSYRKEQFQRVSVWGCCLYPLYVESLQCSHSKFWKFSSSKDTRCLWSKGCSRFLVWGCC